METDVLVHHGIKGMKWYQRRYQNKDGSLTPQGRFDMERMHHLQERAARNCLKKIRQT